MEPKLLTEIENAEYRELRADDLNLVSGGRENGHYQLPGVDLDINWQQGAPAGHSGMAARVKSGVPACKHLGRERGACGSHAIGCRNDLWAMDFVHDTTCALNCFRLAAHIGAALQFAADCPGR